ncbi:MAG: hypothetical protein ACKOUS_15310, partial [Alphaproteobacteria bacterium]
MKLLSIAGEGLASLAEPFAIDGAVHVARWEVRRARGRPDARLQQSEVRLARVEADGTEAALGGRKRDTLAEIQRLLGLGFDQFMRTVVLAQGRFDAFLTAPETERGELLERIVGEEVFSALSRKVFELARTRREAIARASDALDAVAPLDDAARAALEGERAGIADGEAGRRAGIEALRRELEWWRADAKLSAQADAAQASREAAARAHDALGAAREELGLRRAALALAAVLRDAARAEADAATKARGHEVAAAALSGAEAKAREARADVAAARAALATAEADIARLEPEWERAATLDVQVEGAHANARREAEAEACPAAERKAIAALLRDGADAARGEAEATRAHARLAGEARLRDEEARSGASPSTLSRATSAAMPAASSARGPDLPASSRRRASPASRAWARVASASPRAASA